LRRVPKVIKYKKKYVPNQQVFYLDREGNARPGIVMEDNLPPHFYQIQSLDGEGILTLSEDKILPFAP
jgi:hypothetical protein